MNKPLDQRDDGCPYHSSSPGWNTVYQGCGRHMSYTLWKGNPAERKKDGEGTTNETGMLLCSLSTTTSWVCTCERVTHPGADQRQHDSLIECQRFSLLHFDPLFIQTLHGIPETHTVSEHILLSKPKRSFFLVSSLQQHLHFPCVRLSASVHLSKTPSTDDPMHTEVIHCQLHAKIKQLNKTNF